MLSVNDATRLAEAEATSAVATVLMVRRATVLGYAEDTMVYRCSPFVLPEVAGVEATLWPLTVAAWNVLLVMVVVERVFRLVVLTKPLVD